MFTCVMGPRSGIDRDSPALFRLTRLRRRKISDVHFGAHSWYRDMPHIAQDTTMVNHQVLYRLYNISLELWPGTMYSCTDDDSLLCCRSVASVCDVGPFVHDIN